jgi:formylglycine-generating enzyme required for sulfatase activity
LALGAIGDAITGTQLLPGFLTGLPPWAWWLTVAVLSAVVVLNLVLEVLSRLDRRHTHRLAQATVAPRTGYFRIGPYEDRPEDRAAFDRADRAHLRVLEWLESSSVLPLYLSGDSGAGKSSLLHASVLPALREQQWTVVAARAYQDPEAALREALAAGRQRRPDGGRDLRDLVEAAARKSEGSLLLLLDQFEEFLILAPPEVQAGFQAWVAALADRPVKNLKLLLVLRSEYLTDLDKAGFPSPHLGANWFQLACFSFKDAREFMAGSGLGLMPEALDKLLASAAELDDIPGKVRPITLNVLGHVLENGGAAGAGLDAGRLVRQYIAQAVGQPGVRAHAAPVLEQLVTGHATKRPRSEAELAKATGLSNLEVRAVLRGLHQAWLARPLDAARGVWELSHDFIARAVFAYLGRRAGELGRKVLALAGPALLGGLLAMLGSHYVIQWLETRPQDPEMVDIPAGRFCMGSRKPGAPAPVDCPELPEDPEAQSDEMPARRVQVPAFRLGRHEVTAGEFRRYVKSMQARGREIDWNDDVRTVNALPPGERGLKERLPAVNVTHAEAVAYAEWLWEETGRQGPKYRLPTEAEWEYAARAGTTTRRWWGDDPKHEEACAHANVLDRKAQAALRESDRESFACETDGYVWSAPVGHFGNKGANGFGLQDMLGNVWEWMADCWHDSYRGAPAGPEAWTDGTKCASGRRVSRGGSWNSDPGRLRSANRYGFTPDYRYDDLGFRLAQDR